MSEGGTGHGRRRLARAGDEAVDFARWYGRSKFDLMGSFLPDLLIEPAARDPAALERRLSASLRHAKRVLLARGVVTALLALGAIATASATLLRFLDPPSILASDIALWLTILERAAAIAGSVTLLLVLLRLAFDRYLDRVETCALFLAMQLACARRA